MCCQYFGLYGQFVMVVAVWLIYIHPFNQKKEKRKKWIILAQKNKKNKKKKQKQKQKQKDKGFFAN